MVFQMRYMSLDQLHTETSGEVRGRGVSQNTHVNSILSDFSAFNNRFRK